MKPASCHPDRLHHARGLCKQCYQAMRHQERKRNPHPHQNVCEVCRTLYPTHRLDARYCSPLCNRVATAWTQTERRGTRPREEEVVATRDRAVAEDLVRTAKSRGCQRIHPHASGERKGLSAYYSAWYRTGGLYIVRVRWPDGERIAA